MGVTCAYMRKRDRTKREDTVQHWELVHSLSCPFSTLYAWAHTWIPRRRKKNTAGISTLILVLIATCKWGFILQFSVVSLLWWEQHWLSRQEYHLFPPLSYRNVRNMQRQVWLSGWHKQSYVFVSFNMITAFLLPKHPGCSSIIPHLLTRLNDFLLRKRPPLHLTFG